MDMFTLIVDAVIVLTLAVIVLSVFVVLSRLLTDLSEARLHRLRKRMQESLDGYLAGRSTEQAAIAELGRNQKIALGVLVGTAGRLPRAERRRLHGLFGHFRFQQNWIAALKSRRWPVRVHAATQLGYMGEASVPALIEALDDEMLDVRLAAAHALAQLGVGQAVRPILQALALSAAWPLQRCVEILYEMGEPAIEPLLGLLREQGPNSRAPSVTAAIRVLGMLKASAAAPLVARFLHSPNLETRVASARTLGRIGGVDMLPELSAALADPAWEVRSAAAQALGAQRSHDTLTALNNLLADPAWWVRFNAAQSLYQLGDDGRAALKSAMTAHEDAFARDISRQVLEEHGAIPSQETLSS